MGNTKQPENDNDYAIARELHDRASRLISLVASDLRRELRETYYFQNPDKAKSMNRCYVLLVNELEKIYAQNKQLAILNEQPKTSAIWQHFNVIEGNEPEIWKYVEEHKSEEDMAHYAQVNRMAIVAGKEEPDLTPEQQKIVDEADRVTEDLLKYLNELDANRPRKYRGLNFIPKYILTYEMNGNIVVNGVLVLKKTQNGSAPRKLMEQAVKHPNEVFKPELGQLTRNFSSVLSDMGITGTLKELFFPIANKDGVKLRPVVGYETADEERIDTQELDKQLKSLGAKTQHILDEHIMEEPYTEEEKALVAEYAKYETLIKEHEHNEKERKNS